MSKEMNLPKAVVAAKGSLAALKGVTDSIGEKISEVVGALGALPKAKADSAKSVEAESVRAVLEAANIFDHTEPAFQAEVGGLAGGAADAQASVISANDAVGVTNREMKSSFEDAYLPALEEFQKALSTLGEVYNDLCLLKSKAEFLNARLTDTPDKQFDLDPWLLERLVHLSKKGGSSKADKKSLKTKVKKFLIEDDNAVIKTAVDEKKAELRSKGAGDDESVTSAVSSAGSDGGALGGASGLSPSEMMLAVAMFDINESFAKVLGADKKVFDAKMITDVLGTKAPKAKKMSPKKVAESAAADTPSLKDELTNLQEAEKKLVKGAKEADFKYDESIDYFLNTILPMGESDTLADIPEWLVIQIVKIQSGAIKTSSNVSTAVKSLNLPWLNVKLEAVAAKGEFKSPKKKTKADASAADDPGSDGESLFGVESNEVTLKDTLIAVAVHYVNSSHNKLYAGKIKAQQDPLGADTPKYFVHKTKYSTEKGMLKGGPKVVEAAAPPPREPSDDDAAAVAVVPSKGKDGIQVKNNALLSTLDLTKVEESATQLFDSGKIQPVDDAFPFDQTGAHIDTVAELGANVLGFDAPVSA